MVREVCNDSIKPPIPVRVYRMELPDETGALRAVLKVDVSRSLFVHKSPGGYFHRHGSSKREMPPDLLARLFQERSQARVIRFDEQSVPGQCTRNELITTLLARCSTQTINGLEPPVYSKYALKSVKFTIAALDDIESGKPH